MSKLTRLAVMLAALMAAPLAAVADESSPAASAGNPQRASVTLATEAAAEAAERAAESISADQAIKLDVRLNGLTSRNSEAEPVTVAAN